MKTSLDIHVASQATAAAHHHHPKDDTHTPVHYTLHITPVHTTHYTFVHQLPRHYTLPSLPLVIFVFPLQILTSLLLTFSHFLPNKARKTG